MSGLNDSVQTLPDGRAIGLTPEESKKLTRKTNELRDSLGKNCKHLIQSPPGAPPWKRPRRKWSKEAWQQYLGGEEKRTLDDSLAVLPPEDDEVKVAEADLEVDTETAGVDD
jgi:hypothetical protein